MFRSKLSYAATFGLSLGWLLKRLFKKICAHKKSNYNFNNRQKLISSRKNPKIFWQLLKQNTNKSKNIENTCNLQIWKNHFENLLYKENQLPLEYSNFAGREDNNENILNEIITLDEIHKSIRKLKLGKAQGTDGIGAEFYRYTCYEIAPILCTLFNNIYSTGNLPDMWRDSIVIPVYKSGLRDEPANYRGISLINVMYKIFSNILYDRLRKWAELNNKIDEAQSGFRAGYSTTDNIFILQSLVQKYLSKQGGRFYVLYVDFKKAFDSVVHQNLFNCLKNIGVSSKMLKILLSIYSNMRSFVRVNQTFTESFPCNIGTKQGDVTSTILFTLYINELLTFLRNKNHRGIFVTEDIEDVICILFADDIANCADTAINLQLQLNSISEFCSQTGLAVNQSKTEIIVFRNSGPLRNYEHWTYNGEAVNVVTIYKYLGLIFTPTLSWGKAKQKLVAQANKSIFAIKSYQKKFGHFTLSDHFKLFDSMVKPILLYGGDIWGFEYTSEIEKVQIRFCKDFLGVGPSTNDSVALGECGRLPLCVDYFLKCIKYWLKLLYMPQYRLPRNCYKMLKGLDDTGRNNWASAIKHLLYLHGFGNVWLAQEVGNIEVFLSIFKQRVIDCRKQNWEEAINSSSRCSTYKCFKTMLNPERYLSLNISYSLRRNLAKFRCSNHKFKIEVGRHLGIERERRICSFCYNNQNLSYVEDEYHAFFQCFQYNSERKRYLYNWYKGRGTLDNFYRLMKTTEESTIRKIAIFVSAIMKVKESQI